MKKYLLSAALFSMAAFVTSCQNQKNETEEQETPKAEAKDTKGTASSAGLRIAYVDIDTVQAHYKLCTDVTARLEQRSINAQKELQAKTRAFQEHYNALQQKYQNGQFTSQAEFENAQAKLQREQEEGAKRENEISAEIQKLQLEGLQQVNDSVENFIQSYNKTKKYDFILMKATTLYANPACDITDEVIKGLNKRYEESQK